MHPSRRARAHVSGEAMTDTDAFAPPVDASAVRAAPAPVLLHVGFHKTGSTWLQNHLFADPRRFAMPATPRHRLVEDLVVPDPLAFDPAGAAAAYAAPLADAHAAGLTLVLSHERLSGYPSSGGRDRVTIAERLAAAFPQARVLIVIREQRALIGSMYRQHITDGGVESLGRFLDTPEPSLCRKPSFTTDFYAFDRLVALYHRLFGEDRVLVLPVEHLARDPQGFADAIARLCGGPALPIVPAARANQRRPLMMQLVQRPLNLLFYHNELSPGALLHITRFHKRYARLLPAFERLSPAPLERWLARRLDRAIAARIGDLYAESNARTERLTGLDLAALGYPVARG